MPDTPLPSLEARGIPNEADPFRLFQTWLAAARGTAITHPKAMTVAPSPPHRPPTS